VKIQENWKQKNGKYRCPECGKEYSKAGIGTHIWRSHGTGQDHKSMTIAKKNGKKIVAWNKGKTKETDERLRKQGQTYSKRVKEGIIIPSQTGIPVTEETKQKISESMKLAHEEGRAWNIGMSRWNNEPSWPEQFFMTVIENEFDDKEYSREYSVGVFAIDFAWPHKKTAIEIDGSQHKRFKEYQERDERKNKKLKDEGWKVLRIPWIEMFHDTKTWIKRAKEFVDF
jgi:very-short-patch-repair endonuclease/ribosomal protein L37AE/L43A